MSLALMGSAQRAPGNGKMCGLQMCYSTRGAADLRKGLRLKNPGGVLKSGCPGSTGEPGWGLSWLRAWHPGGGLGPPGAEWRAGKNGVKGKIAVHTLKISHSFPGSGIRDWPMGSPCPHHPAGLGAEQGSRRS